MLLASNTAEQATAYRRRRSSRWWVDLRSTIEARAAIGVLKFLMGSLSARVELGAQSRRRNKKTSSSTVRLL